MPLSIIIHFHYYITGGGYCQYFLEKNEKLSRKEKIKKTPAVKRLRRIFTKKSQKIFE